MKILHVNSTLKMGGAEKLTAGLVPALRRLGHKVDIFSLDATPTPLMRLIEERGVEVVGKGLTPLSPYNPLNAARLARLARGYDIVHAHTTPSQVALALARGLLPASTRLVTTEHSTNNRRRGSAPLRLADRWMYSRFDHIACISQTAKDNLLRHLRRGDDTGVSVVENGVDIAAYRHAAPLERRELGLPEDSFSVAMVGRFCTAKDQDTLLRALALLGERFRLVLVGEGERKAALQALARELHVESRVVFTGLRTDVPRILHTVDVVAMSSHWEGLSLSSIEGMAVDKPFVASRVDGLREVVDGAGLLFPEGDHKALAQLLTTLAQDPALYAATARSCLLRASQYDIATTASRYEAIYKALLA